MKQKIDSLSWAIEELSKQKEKLNSNLKIALKREETGSLIEEVNAQKDALDKRIAALQDGLAVSTDLVDTPVEFLESEITKVNDKLEIAQERLQNLEQEQYLEELGRKLNRTQEEEIFDDSHLNDGLSSHSSSLEQTDISEIPTKILSEQEGSTITNIMANTSNRIENDNSSLASLPEGINAKTSQVSQSEKNNPLPVVGLEDTAFNLGVEPDFLVEKGTQALLRMIARNGGQLKFPLEIDQID